MSENIETAIEELLPRCRFIWSDPFVDFLIGLGDLHCHLKPINGLR